MAKYIVTTKSGVNMLFTYNEQGQLVEYSTHDALTIQQSNWLARHFPTTHELLRTLIARYGWQVKEVPQDLSFTAFWNAYRHKVGNKKRAERLWNGLSKEDKAKAIAYLPRYESYLAQNPGIAKLYPETYLNQERWNN